MKRALILGLISILMICVIGGCGNKESEDFSIENHNWTFSNMIDSEKGEIVACTAEEGELYPEAEVMELSCEASTNVMAIRDENGNGVEISYRATGKDTNSLIYELVYQNEEEIIRGMAVSSITEYAKGEYEHTLVIDLGGYALYFFERTER